MSYIRTVLGDIAPDELGVCYAHEHIIIDASYTTVVDPGFLLDDADVASRELAEFHQLGGRAMIDSMPCDCGRNVLKLAEVSRRSGVHIVCPTGLHLAKYYDPGHWGNFYTEDELATLFITEITEGIDAHDCNGPLVKRTPHRAGLIKIATGDSITPRAGPGKKQDCWQLCRACRGLPRISHRFT
jgi:phosphotriesterase-related protein